MFAKIGIWLKQQLLPTLARSSSTVKTWWTEQGPLLLRETLLYGLMLLALVLLLAGCATSSTPPDSMPRNPAKPQPKHSQPSVPYPTVVQQHLSEWAKQLKDMQTTP